MSATLVLNRRDFMAAGASLVLAGGARAGEPGLGTLKAKAARKGVALGSMVAAKPLAEQADLRAALPGAVALLVPGDEMKWGYVQPRPGPPDFTAAESIAGFAQANGMGLRGHTALWYRNLPDWAAQALLGFDGARVMESRVRAVLGQFKGRVLEWDVVNEAVEPKDGEPDFLRASPFYRGLGPGYVASAFRIARETDPNAKLFYNDYGVEYRYRGMDERRAGVLKLLENLKRNDVPIDGLGIQSHLVARLPFDPKLFRRFLAEVAGLGLAVSITEFDVNDFGVEGDIAARDRVIADYARRFLDVALDEKAVRTVMTWGFSNRESWLNTFAPRRDGQQYRPLPFDVDLKPTPLWTAMAQAFDGAPERG